MRALACALLLAGAGIAAAATYDDPWSATTDAAAEAAVARLGAKPARALVTTIRTVPGLALGTKANTRTLAANVQDVKRALKDLGGTETAIEIRIELPGDVLFDVDQAQIRPDAAKSLAQVATVIRAYAAGVRLLGHTDSDGSDAHNLALSQRRAEAVKAWLVQREALDAARFATEGRGESAPRAPNDSAENKQLNRRVEVVVSKQ
jgi:outer membrane protein OmpA-like peptidoglycan-associated protein